MASILEQIGTKVGEELKALTPTDSYSETTFTNGLLSGLTFWSNSSKSTLTGDFLFKKKDKKETSENEERPDVVNKEAIA